MWHSGTSDDSPEPTQRSFFIGGIRRLELFDLAMTHVVEKRDHAEILSDTISISSSSEPDPFVGLVMRPG
jgi:hypothetical protein